MLEAWIELLQTIGALEANSSEQFKSLRDWLRMAHSRSRTWASRSSPYNIYCCVRNYPGGPTVLTNRSHSLS
jgi:hypothetical protein